MKGSYNFQGALRRKVWRYKKRLRYTLKNEGTNFLIWYTKVFLIHYGKTLSENQNIMTYWILMHRGNESPKTWLWILEVCFIHQCEIKMKFCLKQNFALSNPQRKFLGFIWFIVHIIDIHHLSTIHAASDSTAKL